MTVSGLAAHVKSTLTSNNRTCSYYSLGELSGRLGFDLSRLPVSIRILLENLLRHEGSRYVTTEQIESLARWSPDDPGLSEFPFLPARVLMQDFTGVPSVVDLAAMRDALARLGGDPGRINPQIPVHLIIDHSVQVDRFGTGAALEANTIIELERNRERYSFLKWGQAAFNNFKVVPPATGICHQVNLEYLARVVMMDDKGTEGLLAYPDTLVGLDSHTTMVNGLGVLGWGVGGIEAEAVMLGQPVYLLPPRVIGVEVTGRLPEGATATDLVLMITQLMRQKGVVGSFIEFFGDGLDGLSLPDRATIANMTPEFGATATLFPVDAKTLDYLAFTGRSAEQIDLVADYLKAQGLFRDADATPLLFSETLHFDLNTVEPSLAGPKRPHDRVALKDLKASCAETFQSVCGPDQFFEKSGTDAAIERTVRRGRQRFILDHGAVVIAAITSCTNTSNPSVLLGAGLMAKKAVARGLMVPPWVKTSLAPGSTVVADYLRVSGLLSYLEALRFHLVAYGCTTCIGNSGALYPDVADVIRKTDLVAAAVLSGNRNYEGRVNPLTRANYLASPMLVVAFALAGTVRIDLATEPLGHDPNNEPVFLRDIWPDHLEIAEMMAWLTPDMFQNRYRHLYEGNDSWHTLPEVHGRQYPWAADSTYIKAPPFFEEMTAQVPELSDICEARVLALLGHTITTDHISPAGAIPGDSPAARYLEGQGVVPEDFNAFGARRGNHEVMMRGTFGNVRLRNQLAPDTEGGLTTYLPDGEVMPIYDAAQEYRKAGASLLIIAGKEYGSGSSRDWAAKGTLLLGVRAVLAESFERIHRSNLVAMGVLPLQFQPGESALNLGLTGREVYAIAGISSGLMPGQMLTVEVDPGDGKAFTFEVIVRIDSKVEVDYYRHGGILPYVLRQIMTDHGE